jgi:hypothetical protein
MLPRSLRQRIAAWSVAALVARILLAPCPSHAASGDTVPKITLGDGTLVELIVHLYGATISQGWSEMPSRMAPDYVRNSPLERLDQTLPVYIDWEIPTYIMPGGCAPCAPPNPTRVNPPRPLASEPWFVGHANDFIPLIVQPLDTMDYTACAADNGLEQPLTTPLSASGRMRVADIHGGTSGDTAIFWLRYVCVGSFCEYWVFVVRWNRAQTYTDEDTGARVDALPQQAVTRPNEILFPRRCPTPCVIANLWSEMFVTQWVSTDASETSRRIVDASDLAALSVEFGNPVRWGYDPPVGGGPASRNYHLNFAPFNDVIDTADLSAYAFDIGKSCGLTKTTPEGAPDALMQWFGFARTGRQIEIVPGQPSVPEWKLVDATQNHRAILDPHGYRPRINDLENLPWGTFKRLYR